MASAQNWLNYAKESKETKTLQFHELLHSRKNYLNLSTWDEDDVKPKAFVREKEAADPVWVLLWLQMMAGVQAAYNFMGDPE